MSLLSPNLSFPLSQPRNFSQSTLQMVNTFCKMLSIPNNKEQVRLFMPSWSLLEYTQKDNAQSKVYLAKLVFIGVYTKDNAQSKVYLGISPCPENAFIRHRTPCHPLDPSYHHQIKSRNIHHHASSIRLSFKRLLSLPSRLSRC